MLSEDEDTDGGLGTSSVKGRTTGALAWIMGKEQLRSKTNTSVHQCPACHGTLLLEPTHPVKADSPDGFLRCKTCTRTYELRHGLPNLVYPEPEELPEIDQTFLDQYQRIAASYDRTIRILTLLLGSWEPRARRHHLIDPLAVKPGDAVLEVGTGTGSNLPLIAERIGPQGTLCAMDLSPGMLAVARHKATHRSINAAFALGNAAYLPYKDVTFDAVLHFGGINTFGEKSRAIEEMLRVVKPGGRVVIGDEGLAPGKEHTRFGKWLLSKNRLFAHRPPHELFADDLSPHVRWMWRGLFYVVEVTRPV